MNNNQRNTKNQERFALILYSVYHISILAGSIGMEWESWSAALAVAAFAASWMIFLLAPKDLHFRAGFYLGMIMLSETVYAYHATELTLVFVSFLSVVVITGLFGYADLFWIPLVTFLIMVAYHILARGYLDVDTRQAFFFHILPPAGVLMTVFVVRFWVVKRNESQRILVKTISELQKTERVKDDFLANVSHEIRTPINTISGMSEILLMEDDPFKLKEDIQAIQVAGHNLMGVVSDILDFSELQSGEVDLAEEAYNITSTINDIINMTNAMKNKKNLELVVDIDNQIPKSLLGDEKKIRRVILNLVNNAIKFTDEGGVSIVVGFRRENYGINLNITVSDTGIGMDQKSVERLFSSYNQVDTSRRRVNGGVGLGLAISQAMVRSMGGVIRVKSRLKKGTTINVTIPQKVLDEEPIAQFDHSDDRRMLVYLDMEQFEMQYIRDAYSGMLHNMVKHLGVHGHICRNLMELKRREEREDYSHIFIGLNEYQEDTAYFAELAKKTHVVVVLEREDEKRLKSDQLLCIYKPFYILPVISVLNGTTNTRKVNFLNYKKNFIAPDAHVLVVDDNAMNIKVVEGLLSKYQIKVTRALSGMEALEKIKDRCYDFVFMDHMMPEMDGVETFHRIRQMGGKYCETVPIVALTANAVAGARKMMLSEGFTDFMEKPVECSVLERMLRRLLPRDKIIYVDEDAPAVQEAPQVQEPEEEKGFAVGDLDVEQGMVYCGGQELYIGILKEYAAKGSGNWEPVEELFANQDWKNYVISVHAIKSSMLAIGAKPLSELAKALELEGKAEHTDYILEHHAEMIREYKRVIGEICAYFSMGQDSEEIKEKEDGEPAGLEPETIELPVLTEEAFDEAVIELEDAMYDLDGSQMLKVLDRLGAYAYCGTPMKEALAPVRHKVEMSDFMSAVEAVLRLKDRIKAGK
jgi:signal transduction histidine kinase/DNA-binding response OmpR family regulator